MKYVVYGAGAVGGVIAGHLSLAGRSVSLVARGAHLAAIREGGLRLDTASGMQVIVAPATDTAAEIDWTPDTVVILAVKSHQAAVALEDLRTHAPADTPIVCATNGVATERVALRVFARVHALCVMLPATHVESGLVVAKCHPIPGVLDVGRYPSGVDEVSEQIAADLRSAGFESVVRPDIMAWKHRKLVTNVVGDVSAVAPNDADRLRPLVRTEAEAALAAAGVHVVSHDEDAERRGDLLQMRSDVGGPNSLGQSLLRKVSGTEIDYRAGEIVLLGRLHGVATPACEEIVAATGVLSLRNDNRPTIPGDDRPVGV